MKPPVRAGSACGSGYWFSSTRPPGSIRFEGMMPFGNPSGIRLTSSPERPRPGSSLKFPLRIALVGTHDFTKPVSSRCLKYSKPTKKNTLSRFLLKPVPGIKSGPLRLKPG
ncbi:MAG: hypothetical protein DMF82_23535 [Acidobacteria bacterium]|nr:MAG: hypothetical protein DMF82_23535 [Acidobacteriota bacterium]